MADSRNLGTMWDKERFWKGKIPPVFQEGRYQTYIKMLRSQKVQTRMCM
jgi:hypothetical protein